MQILGKHDKGVSVRTDVGEWWKGRIHGWEGMPAGGRDGTGLARARTTRVHGEGQVLGQSVPGGVLEVRKGLGTSSMSVCVYVCMCVCIMHIRVRV